MTFRYFHPIAFNAGRFTVSSAAMFLVLKKRGEFALMAASLCLGWRSAESTRLLGKYGPIRLTVTTMIARTAMMVPMSLLWIIAQPWPSIAPIAWLGLGYSALLSIAYGYFV